MKKMSRTAKVLDRIIAVIYWVMLVMTVLCVIAVALLAVVNHRIPDRSDWPLTSLELGGVELVLHPDAVPAGYGNYLVLLSVYALLGMPLYCIILLTIRDILKPFILRRPFHATVAKDLHRLAILVTVHTILTWVGSVLMTNMTRDLFDPAQLLRSEQVLDVVLNYSFDITPLLFAGALYLLSKVFLYGQELQQLSDETL